MTWAVVSLVLGIGLIVWGSELFAEHLAAASARLGVSTFALAVLLAGAEPEELATAVTAGLRDVPAVAFGDVVGANAAICLVALAVGAWISPLPFPPRVRRYALLAAPAAVLCVTFAWDGALGRAEGAVLVGGYVAYVATIWRAERRPPSLGEVDEVAEALEEIEAEAEAGAPQGRRVGRDLVLVVVGFVGIVSGATLLVGAVERFTSSEHDQTRVSLTAVGFATAFELVVLAWSSARRGMSEAVVAAVVGSYAYNVTMTIGVAAIVAPLRMADATVLRLPMVAMVGALCVVMALVVRRPVLERGSVPLLLAGYAAFVGLALSV